MLAPHGRCNLTGPAVSSPGVCHALLTRKCSSRFVALIFALLSFDFAVRADTQSLETLLAYLKSPNSGTRRDAAHKLGERRVRNQLAVEALAVAARKDEDHEVRAEAASVAWDDQGLLGAARDARRAQRSNTPRCGGVAIRSLVAMYTEHDIDFITNRRAGWNLFNPFLDTSDHEIVEPYVSVEPLIVTSDRRMQPAAIATVMFVYPLFARSGS